MVALAAAAWSVVAAVLSAFVQGWASVAAVFAVMTTLGVLGLARAFRSYARRAGMIASVVVLAWAPIVLFLCADAANQPLVTSGVRCGTGMMAFLFLAVPIALAVGFSVLGALGIVVARAPAADGVLRAAATAAVIGGALVIGLALRKRGVDQDAYSDALVVIAESTGPTNGVVFREDDGCTVTLPDPRGAVDTRGAAAWALDQANPEPCPRRRVVQDPRVSITFVQADVPGVGWTMVSAVQGHEVKREVTTRDVATSIRPSRGWVGGAIAGVSLALVALAWAAALRRKLGRLLGGALVQGTHLGDGWVEVEGHGRRRLRDAFVPIGPVVIEDAPERGATYRDDGVGRAALVRRGTVADLLEATRDARADAWGLAVCAVALSVTPLLAARIQGIF